MKSPSNTQEVFAVLRRRITSGEYRPSETLTEASLCADLGVSRTTIKKVLLMLEKEGLVLIEQNKSAKVRAFTLDEILELLDVRIVLEGFVVQNATARISAEQLEALAGILRGMEDCVKEKRLLDYSRYNRQFHSVIYDACSNHSAVELLRSLKEKISRFDLKTILIPGRDEQSLAEHTALYDSLRAGDAGRAAQLVEVHVRNIKEILERYSALLL